MSRPIRALALLAVALLGPLAPASHAAGTAAEPTYANECGSCHVPYPTRLLGRADWSRVLGTLDRHYGVDASLDAAALQAVSRHLDARPVAATSASLPRITAQPWFRNEHDEVSPATFRSGAVRGAANCSACHPAAERGDFDEHSIVMPGGRRHDD